MRLALGAALVVLAGCAENRKAGTATGAATAAGAATGAATATGPAAGGGAGAGVAPAAGTGTAAAVATAADGPPIPPRKAGALTGRQFLVKTASLPRHSKTAFDREEAIVAELLAGNVPDYCRTFVDVTITTATHTATIHVLPDYLAIGSNADNVRIPMGAPSAQKIADAFDCVLPTSEIVDVLWQKATIKLAPKPLAPTAEMIKNSWFLKHADLLDAQLAGKPRGVLTAGHKKDVIASNKIALAPGRVVIYGWHQPNGKPIQPRSSVHEATYADYSHGVRLVGREMELDGRTVLVNDVLKDAKLAAILSDEGPIVSPRY